MICIEGHNNNWIKQFLNLKTLLIFIPISLGLYWFEFNPIIIFVASGMAIIPLATIMGEATEALAEHLGQTYGGLLNATMSNAPELIINLFALWKGLIDIVKASLCGAILGMLLCGMGLAMFAGGIKNGVQSFNTKMTGLNASLLLIVTFGLVIPSVFHFSTASDREISTEIAVVLFLLYLASMIATLISRQPAVGPSSSETESAREDSKPDKKQVRWSLKKALLILAAVAAGLGVMSEIITEAIQPTASALGFTEIFAGVFLLALVGCLAEFINASKFALSNRMDLALIILMGAATQLSLLVAPVLVFCGYLFGQDMNLLFNKFEIIAIILAVILTRFVTEDGRSNWLEGAMLMAVYIMLGFAFYHIPAIITQ